MSNGECPFCGLPKYEYGVRNCCEEGQAEEYGENLKNHQEERMNKLAKNITKIVEENEKQSQLSLFENRD